MTKELIKYPQSLGKEFNAPVRFFDETLNTLIEDLKDTIEENNLDGLSAFQIGNPYNVVVIKNSNEFLVMVNPKIYQENGSVTSEEITTYFGDISASLTRASEIKITYEDKDGNTKYLTANNDLAILIQRKVDYTFGGTIRYRLKDKKQDEFDTKLQYGNNALQNASCPTNSFKDKISIFINYLTVFSFVSLLFIFILSDKNILLLEQFENYSMITILTLILIYVPYGYYEGKLNKGCTSCQIGNILGTAVIALVKLSILYSINYFIF